MQLATWNVNSLGVRLPQVLDWLAAHPVDVLALQELKLTDDKFPAQAFADAGYQAQWFGQKTYNGVALISRTSAADVVKNIPGFADEQSRVLCATIDGVRVIGAYFPNGQAPGSDKFAYKMAWLQALRAWVAQELAAHPKLVLLGDFSTSSSSKQGLVPPGIPGEGKLRQSSLTLAAGGRVHASERSSLDLLAGFRHWDVDASVDVPLVGLSRAPDAPAAALIEAINGCGMPVFALDTPSGVSADRGAADGARGRQAVRRHRFGTQAGGEAIDALAVNRVDLELARQRQRFEHTASEHGHGVGRCVLHGDIRAVGFTVIEHARQLMHLLMQAAAERHVHFLEATANAQHWNTGRHGRADQRQGRAVPLWIVFGAGGAGGALIVEGFHVRGRAGQ